MNKIKDRRLKLLITLLLCTAVFGLGRMCPDLWDMELLCRSYTVAAKFDDVGGLKGGDPVTIAGIRVGKVESVSLDGCSAKVILRLKDGITVQDDSVASIKTTGIMGGKYVQICTGGSEKAVGPGGSIRDTESALDPERLIANYAYGKL